MYIKRTVRRRGDKVYEYLSLVQAVREGTKVKHETLLRLGEASQLSATGELDRIVSALSRHCDETWLAAGQLGAEDAPGIGAIAAIAAVWHRLGLDAHFDAIAALRRLSYSLSDAVFAMVASRLTKPSSKRAIPEWAEADVAMPAGFSHPELDNYYWALDQVATAKEETEAHLYSALCDLTNLDLRLICYDLTSTYFETARTGRGRFPSLSFGYSRDHRGDRPQVVLGLVTTSDGIPIAHHVFSGQTADVSTLQEVLTDTKARFALGPVCVVADRGLISSDNIDAIRAAGCDYVMATRLHKDPIAKAAIEASAAPGAVWIPVEDASSGVCEVEIEGRRLIVAASFERHSRDEARRGELVEETEDALLALEARVRAGRLKDGSKIGAAADRILRDSGVARLFEIEVGQGHFLYHYDEGAYRYEEALAGRYVLSTSLGTDSASPAQVLRHYRRLLKVEHEFKVMKDFIALRPVYHWTESRVRGHIAICVLAAAIEALIAKDLEAAKVGDPDIDGQTLSPKRALRELERIRLVKIMAGDKEMAVVTRRSPLQSQILKALGADTSAWKAPQVA